MCMHTEPTKNNMVFHKNTCSVEIINACIMEMFLLFVNLQTLIIGLMILVPLMNAPKHEAFLFMYVKVAQTCIF